jgi:hypothetical protein
MIGGPGSASWKIVRDLAARLPLMLLPQWTQSYTQPVAIEDVVEVLAGALALELDGSAWFDTPGPETLSGERPRTLASSGSSGAGSRYLATGVVMIYMHMPKMPEEWADRGAWHLVLAVY